MPELTMLKQENEALTKEKLQTKVIDKGLNPGAIDGDFGENTQVAVKAFQRSVGLEDDGIVGEKFALH